MATEGFFAAFASPFVVAGLVIALTALVALWVSFAGRGDGRRAVAVIGSIGTSNPPYFGGPHEFLAICRKMGYDADLLAKVEKIVLSSGVDRRFTAVGPAPADDGPVEGLKPVKADPERFMSILEEPTDNMRARLWEQWAPKRALGAARDALRRWDRGTARDITHVVVHSCTGFSAPGLDFALIEGLGLSPSTRKVGVNFMGCFGAFTGLYVAKQIVEADPTGKACVLVACVELCSVHMQGHDHRLELIVGNAIFGDGGGAAIVCHAGRSKTSSASSASSASSQEGEWALGIFESDLLAGTSDAMTWKQGRPCTTSSSSAGADSVDKKEASSGSRGGGGGAPYEMWLDRKIPSALTDFFASGKGIKLAARVGILNPWKSSLVWAIHPGGKAVITALEKAFSMLKVKGRGLEVSREVLRQHGNMSSPTILFVLQRVLWPEPKPASEGGEALVPATDVFASGFGPGLTVEAARIYRI